MANFYQALKDELTNDPDTKGYDTMTMDQKIASLNTQDIPQNVSNVSGSQIYDAIDQAEFETLIDNDRVKVDRITSIEGTVSILPGSRARVALTNVFNQGGTPISLAALGAMQTRNVSWGANNGYGKIGVGYIQNAESLP